MNLLNQTSILMITSIWLLNCASANVNLIDPSKKYESAENVILLFEEPQRAYDVIAIIEGNGSQYQNDSQVIKAIRKKAKKIGAHAIIPISNEKEYVAPATIANPVQGSAPIYIAGGNKIISKYVAIRFLDKN